MTLPKGLTISFVVLVLPLVAHADVITVMINPSNDSIYYLLTSDDWIASQAEAVSLGGNLVTIDDAAENQWILENFTFFGEEYRDLWIGLNDVDVEGNMVWVSGAPVTYTNWQPNEPNNAGGEQDFGIMFAGPAGSHISGWFPGGWDDFTSPENLRSDYLMRSGGMRNVYGLAEVISVPEPSTLALLTLGLLGIGLTRRRRASFLGSAQ